MAQLLAWSNTNVLPGVEGRVERRKRGLCSRGMSFVSSVSPSVADVSPFFSLSSDPPSPFPRARVSEEVSYWANQGEDEMRRPLTSLMDPVGEGITVGLCLAPV